MIRPGTYRATNRSLWPPAQVIKICIYPATSRILGSPPARPLYKTVRMYLVPVLRRSLPMLLFAALIANTATLWAQPDEQPKALLTGQASLTGDFYSLDSSPGEFLQPRRPSSLVRLVVTPTLTYGDLKLPLTLVLASTQTNVTTPRAPDQSLTQFIQNPMNRLSFSPEYKWVTVNLGTHIPRYSELTTGSQSAFGAGIDLHPGSFRFTAFRGTSQRAIEPDSVNRIVGAYARRILAGRMAVGSEDGVLFGLNAVRVEDDTTSITPQLRGGLLPQEGITGSADIDMKIAKKITLKAEFAGSAFSRNLRSPEIADAEVVSPIMTVRESTRLDYGARAELDYTEQTWGATATARYLGDGFVPLGYPYAQSDLAEISIAPRAQLLDNKLLLNGTLGYRVNNLQNTSLATSNQIIGTLNATARIGKSLMISGNYTNFGFESTLDQDTLKIKTVTQSFTLSPTLILQGESATNSISLSFSLSDFTEDNTLTSLQSVNDMLSLVGSWSLSMRSIPFSSTATASYVQNNLALGTLKIFAGSLSGSYRLLSGDLTPSLRLSWSQNSIGSASPDNQLGLRLALAWRMLKSVTLNLSGSATRHEYGDIRPGASYTEYLLRTGITTRF